MIPVVLQAVLRAGAAHELPDALGLGPRQRGRLEGAFDQRHVGQVERQALGAEDALDHRQVLRAALQALGQEVAQPALEQLDVAQHAVVQRDRDVVLGLLPGRPRTFGWSRRRRRRGRRSASAAARRSRPARTAVSVKPSPWPARSLQGADAVDQPVEVRRGCAGRRGRRRGDSSRMLERPVEAAPWRRRDARAPARRVPASKCSVGALRARASATGSTAGGRGRLERRDRLPGPTWRRPPRRASTGRAGRAHAQCGERRRVRSRKSNA